MAEFTQTIQTLNTGKLETELSGRLKEVIAAVRDTGKTGKITLTLVVEQDKKNERLISVAADIAVKMPEAKRPASHFIVHNDTLIALEDTQIRLNFGMDITPEPTGIALTPKAAEPDGFREVEVLK